MDEIDWIRDAALAVLTPFVAAAGVVIAKIWKAFDPKRRGEVDDAVKDLANLRKDVERVEKAREDVRCPRSIDTSVAVLTNDVEGLQADTACVC